jgi:hypothetical protein
VRIVAQKIGEAWQQQVIIDNRAGRVMLTLRDCPSLCNRAQCHPPCAVRLSVGACSRSFMP